MTKEDFLKKWINDELSPAEKLKFEQEEDYAAYQSILDGAQKFKASNFSEPESFNSFKLAYDAQLKRTTSLNWFKPLLRIASVVIIVLGVYFTMFNESLTRIETVASQHKTIELPDQSQVTLNAESEIKFDNKEWEENRVLNLKGEAYFKVEKGKTFDIITSQGTVTVVGTEFNVIQRQDYFEVQCYEGSVSVTTNAHVKTLLAGDTFREFANVITQDKTDVLEPQWIKNRSAFKAIPFEIVLAEIARQYNIKIIVKQVQTDRLFTGGFVHDDIEKALSSITQPMGLRYKMNASNEVVVYGNKK